MKKILTLLVLSFFSSFSYSTELVSNKSLIADIEASCSRYTERNSNSFVIYEEEVCVKKIKEYMPGFVFEYKFGRFAAHAGYIPRLELFPISYKIPKINVRVRLLQLEKASCVTQVLSVKQIIELRFDALLVKKLLEKKDTSRLYVLTFNSSVRNWDDYKRCFDEVNQYVPYGSVVDIHEGAPLRRKNEYGKLRPGYMSVRLMQ